MVPAAAAPAMLGAANPAAVAEARNVRRSI